MIPLIGVAGKAGSGKDSFGGRLAERYDGVCIGLADPMKRMMAELFGFTDTQLYGPSEERNRVDPGFTLSVLLSTSDRFPNGSPGYRLSSLGPRWVQELGLRPETAEPALAAWFNACVRQAESVGGLSPRYVLQTLGTEWGRAQDPEVWSRLAVKTGRILLGGEHTYTRHGGLVRVPEKKRPPSLVVITDARFANEITNIRSAGGIVVEIRRSDAADTASTGIAGHSSEAGLDEVPVHFYDHRYHNNGSLADLLAAADDFGICYLTPGRRFETRRNSAEEMIG